MKGNYGKELYQLKYFFNSVLCLFLLPMIKQWHLQLWTSNSFTKPQISGYFSIMENNSQNQHNVLFYVLSAVLTSSNSCELLLNCLTENALFSSSFDSEQHYCFLRLYSKIYTILCIFINIWSHRSCILCHYVWTVSF